MGLGVDARTEVCETRFPYASGKIGEKIHIREKTETITGKYSHPVVSISVIIALPVRIRAEIVPESRGPHGLQLSFRSMATGTFRFAPIAAQSTEVTKNGNDFITMVIGLFTVVLCTVRS